MAALDIYKHLAKLKGKGLFIFFLIKEKHGKLQPDLCVIMHADRSWYELGKNLLFELSGASIQTFN